MSISVVIPTYNRKEYVLNTVRTLLEQDYHRYEVIVIDDGSNDGTYESLSKISDSKLRMFKQKNKGPAAARNKGIREASYDIIAFTDDDCLPKKTWLSELAVYYSDRKVMGVGGIMYTPKEWIKPLTHHALPLKEAREFSLRYRFPPTSNVSYRKSLLNKIGLFDEKFQAPTTEDVDLFIRATKAGRVVIDRNIAMPHIAGKSTLRKEINRFIGFYKGYKIIKEKYPKEFSQIYVCETPNEKFKEMALSIPSLKKISSYSPKDLLRPITLAKLLIFFIVTRLYIIIEGMK